MLWWEFFKEWQFGSVNLQTIKTFNCQGVGCVFNTYFIHGGHSSLNLISLFGWKESDEGGRNLELNFVCRSHLLFSFSFYFLVNQIEERKSLFVFHFLSILFPTQQNKPWVSNKKKCQLSHTWTDISMQLKNLSQHLNMNGDMLPLILKFYFYKSHPEI